MAFSTKKVKNFFKNAIGGRVAFNENFIWGRGYFKPPTPPPPIPLPLNSCMEPNILYLLDISISDP
jgi:hypothetical protein